jgi:hypothetical protein
LVRPVLRSRDGLVRVIIMWRAGRECAARSRPVQINAVEERITVEKHPENADQCAAMR